MIAFSDRYAAWRHVFKLDPDRAISDEALERVCLSGTDGILVGGSSGITYDNTVELMARIRRFEVPCALELTGADSAVPGFDGYFVPMVLNAKRMEWLVGRQVEALAEYGAFMPWELTAAQAYLILNGECTAAQVTEARTALTADEVLAYGQLADRLWRVPVLYLEYSGAFGDMELVRKVRDQLTQARLFYGGGIATPEQARVAAASAHTVVVGNVIYSDLNAALATVDAAKREIVAGGPA
ncbi:heptaprenylglyceryl phosphate synthase [Cohnella ginsengisoli]|uniref:Heptaprenylglyceryl phosphate synthase n=1 Tax=Cohnella ginsengisoli TaxID=425004 RepID=A0A9X4KMJ7_9BACL|nr:heptaprenylglyceryl phosphate synthase [Cohnella ginsengisoli]MDG0794650.1 heptaprenylglyceryl phosphate synthase [Cohnella ginsengisoli]